MPRVTADGLIRRLAALASCGLAVVVLSQGPRSADRVACITSIGDTIRQQTEGEPPDIKAVMGRIGELLDESIVPGGYAIRPEGSAVIDISKIDFGNRRLSLSALGRRRSKKGRPTLPICDALLHCLKQSGPG